MKFFPKKIVNQKIQSKIVSLNYGHFKIYYIKIFNLLNYSELLSSIFDNQNKDNEIFNKKAFIIINEQANIDNCENFGDFYSINYLE